MQRILISLLSISLALVSFAQGKSIPKSSKVQAEELPEILPDSVKYRYPLVNGLAVTVNIFDPVMQIFGSDNANYEATLTADLHHRFFPQISAGIGYSKDKNDDGLRFMSKAAPFLKVGMLYNVKYNDTKPDDFYYILLRYGFSKSKADLENLTYTDGYWDDYGPTTVSDVEYSCHWIEVGGGINVKFMKHISLGWEVSLRPMLSSGDNKYGKPVFVPGYGTGRFSFVFNLTYDLY